MAPPDRLDIERRMSLVGEVRYAAGGTMPFAPVLDALLNVLTLDERRWCCAWGWARCICMCMGIPLVIVGAGAWSGKVLEDVVRVRLCE